MKTTNKEGKPVYRSDFLNYSLDNFAVRECGSLRDIIKYNNLKIDVVGDSQESNMF